MRSCILHAVCGLGICLGFLGCTLDREGTGGEPDAGMGAGQSTGGASTMDASAGGTGGFDGSAGTQQGGQGGAAGIATGGTGGIQAGGSAGEPGGSGGGLSDEVCDDGIDNDGNGLVDCEDGACKAVGYRCVPAVPEEWEGYFWIHVRPYQGEDEETSCPGGEKANRYYSRNAEKAICDPCACSPLEGTLCDAPGIACDYKSKGCANAVPQPDLENFDCHNLSGSSISCQLTGNNPIAKLGSCAPIDEVPDFPNKFPFQDAVDLCAAPPNANTHGCDSQICMPPGEGGFAGAICIMQESEQSECPPQWDAENPLRLHLLENAIDTRSCSPCSCTVDGDSIDCEGGSYKVYDDDGCKSCNGIFCDDEMIVSTTECINLSKLADWDTISIRANARPTPKNGKCRVSGGVAQGSVQTMKGVTLCCVSP